MLTLNPATLADSRCSARRLALMPTNPRPIRILTVDDHALLRVGIAALVSGEADMELVGEACNGQEALEKYRLHRPDITLMDIQMPLMNGVETIIGIRGEFPAAPWLRKHNWNLRGRKSQTTMPGR